MGFVIRYMWRSVNLVVDRRILFDHDVLKSWFDLIVLVSHADWWHVLGASTLIWLLFIDVIAASKYWNAEFLINFNLMIDGCLLRFLYLGRPRERSHKTYFWLEWVWIVIIWLWHLFSIFLNLCTFRRRIDRCGLGCCWSSFLQHGFGIYVARILRAKQLYIWINVNSIWGIEFITQIK